MWKGICIRVSVFKMAQRARSAYITAILLPVVGILVLADAEEVYSIVLGAHTLVIPTQAHTRVYRYASSPSLTVSRREVPTRPLASGTGAVLESLPSFHLS